MLAAIICTDKPGAIETRKANRDDHITYLKSTDVVHAGPFLNADGMMYGSLVVIEVDDMTAAQDWADNDPYAKAGLFDAVRIEQWNKVIG